MAHLIAPPSSVQPMTKEDVAVVQAEKRVDAATREQLVKVYGDSRDPHSRTIELTRPPHRSWMCTSCGKVSTDIRHLCGYCLCPEPGYCVNERAKAAKAKAEAGMDARLTAAEVARSSSSGDDVRRPGTNNDADVQLLHISSTKRTYRLFTEPHVPTTASYAKASQLTAKMHEEEEEGVMDEMDMKEGDEDKVDDVWDDEPDCGEGQSCRPGSGGGCNKCGSSGEAATAASTGARPEAERRPPNEEKVDGGFTHFVSIPLGKLPAITANADRVLEDLRSFVGGADSHAEAEEENGEGEDRNGAAASRSAATPDLVTSTAKLHVTLLMLTLPRREDVEFAKELLQGPFAAAWAAVKEKAVAALQQSENNRGNSSGASSSSLLLSGDTSIAPARRHPLLRLGGGLQVMKTGNDNELYQPQKASVVYMGVDDPRALATVQQLQQVLHDSFAELIHDADEAERSRRVLHVTLMNKKWRKARGAPRPFDARPIVEVFQDAVIGAGDDGKQFFEIPELELCSLRRLDAETGTYFAEAVVKI